ncbi:type II toxin-antitoxin system RelE/ParE family toxin [Alteromonas gracilis]|uniref:type II toxin-antitoxin system RelE/ParE family toxin n=1 Tax=Alteromonas gracilis TaxID=1479524 RepID=UPI0036F2C26B
MQKNRYKISKLAQAHLRKIKSYSVNNFSEVQWRNDKDTLLTGFQTLADNPAVGRSCDEIYPNGFYFPVGKHTAYFTKEDGFILVVAILGQSQLPENHLSFYL